MANTPYIPNIRYSGTQILLSSGKVTLHSKDDSIMLFSKKAIALSSLGTLNIDVKDKVLINAPKIELGLNAEKLGEPIILGNKNKLIMERLLDVLISVGGALASISETELEKAIGSIIAGGTKLVTTCPELKASLSGSLSSKTYTL